jgi:hypothetical protein
LRKRTVIIFIAVALTTEFQICFGLGRGGNIEKGPQLSITTTNQSVILTWRQTPTNWALLESPALDTSYVSNGVVFIKEHRRTIIPSANYGTNGTNQFVVLSIDYSANQFDRMQTNGFPPPPSPP